MDSKKLKHIIEAALMAAAKPLSIKQLEEMFNKSDKDKVDRNAIKKAIAELQEEYKGRAIELKEVANGFRIQVVQEYEPWIGRLWEEKPPRYSRALLETLAIIAYRQPITRGEIEAIRGVAVSTNITRTLQEREWIRVVGHRDVPGKPAMFGTTKEFLDYFNLKHLDELPTLSELKDLDSMHHPELNLEGHQSDIEDVVAEPKGQGDETAAEPAVADNVVELGTATDKAESVH